MARIKNYRTTDRIGYCIYSKSTLVKETQKLGLKQEKNFNRRKNLMELSSKQPTHTNKKRMLKKNS
jgi:hypothetical protein